MDKYIFDVDISRSHELKYKEVLRPLVYEISLIPYVYLFLDPISSGFTREHKRTGWGAAAPQFSKNYVSRANFQKFTANSRAQMTLESDKTYFR